MEPVSIVFPGGTKNGPNGSSTLTSTFTFLIKIIEISITRGTLETRNEILRKIFQLFGIYLLEIFLTSKNFREEVLIAVGPKFISRFLFKITISGLVTGQINFANKSSFRLAPSCVSKSIAQVAKIVETRGSKVSSKMISSDNFSRSEFFSCSSVVFDFLSFPFSET